jgi:hypothetical protein
MNNEVEWRYAGVRRLTKALHYLFYISLALIPAALILDVAEYNLLVSMRDNSFDPALDIVAQAEASDRHQFIMGIAQTCLSAATTILWFVWVFKNNKLARALGATMKYSAASCVWWYFVPILNLFHPYMSMKETYLATLSPSTFDTKRDPSEQPESLHFVGLWWLLWIVDGWLGRFAFKYAMKAESIEQLVFSNKIMVASELVSVVAVVTSVLLIKRMWAAQAQAFAALKVQSPEAEIEAEALPV